MVSYMYQYENGIKRKNVGYVRVEVKNGQCKFTIHMQLLGQTDSVFPTYLLHRDSKGLELIYLGDSLLKAHLIDSRFIADEGNIMNSGCSLKDISGVLIFMNNNIFFATVWNDYIIKADELLEAMKPKKRDNENKKPEGKDHEAREPGVRESIGGLDGKVPASKALNSMAPNGMATDNIFAAANVAAGTVDKGETAGEKTANLVADDTIAKGKINEDFAAENASKDQRDSKQYIEKTKEQDKEDIKLAAEKMQPEVQDTDDYVYGEEKLSLEEELKIPTYKFPRGLKTVEMFRRSQAIAEAYRSVNEKAESRSKAEEAERAVVKVGQEDTGVKENATEAKDTFATKETFAARDNFASKDAYVAKDTFAAKDPFTAKDASEAKETSQSKGSFAEKDAYTAVDAGEKKASDKAEDKYENYYEEQSDRAVAAETVLETKPYGSRIEEKDGSGLPLSEADRERSDSSKWTDTEAAKDTQKQAGGIDSILSGGRTQTQIGGRKEAQPYRQRIDKQTDSKKSEGQAFGGRTDAQPYSGSPASPDGSKTLNLDGIMSRFSRLYPFEDNEMLICVKIEPKDIGLLPKEYWHLSSNSFLLHGYYCYRHLLLAKMKYKDRPVYILGVPGLYQHREQFMARMFGFDSFKSIKKREPKKGDFGYWYLQLNC